MPAVPTVPGVRAEPSPFTLAPGVMPGVAGKPAVFVVDGRATVVVSLGVAGTDVPSASRPVAARSPRAALDGLVVLTPAVADVPGVATLVPGAPVVLPMLPDTEGLETPTCAVAAVAVAKAAAAMIVEIFMGNPLRTAQAACYQPAACCEGPRSVALSVRLAPC